MSIYLLIWFLLLICLCQWNKMLVQVDAAAGYKYQPVENEVWCKQHEETELIALTSVTKSRDLIRKSAETSARYEYRYVAYIADDTQARQHIDRLLLLMTTTTATTTVHHC